MQLKSKVFCGKSGFFDQLSVGSPQQEGAFFVSGDASFEKIPTVSGVDFLLSSDSVNFYPSDNPSGYATKEYVDQQIQIALSGLI